MKELSRGVRDVGRGLAFLRTHPRLWRWVIAPALVTLVLLIGIGVGVWSLAEPLVMSVTARLPSWLEGAAGWLLWAIVLVALSIAGLLVFVAVAGIVAGPFNELLSEAVEETLTGRPGPAFSLRALVRSAVQGIAHGLRRLAVYLIGIALLFALSFVPVVGTIAAAVIGGWLAARATAYDCYDAVLARRALSYRAKQAYLSAHRSRSFGLGAAVAGMLLVPGLNLIALGIGATAATIAAHELDV